MIVRYTAEVEGRVVDSKEREFSLNDFTVQLHFEAGWLQRVSIEKELSESELNEFTNRLTTSEEGRHTLEISGPEGLHERAVDTLQTIESHFGIHGVESVNWENAEQEFIPQSDEEEDMIAATGFQLEKSYPEAPHEWTFSFSHFDWGVVEKLKFPLAFWRRGHKFYREFDYVSAYMNFYYIIEGLYSNGNHSNVEREYLSSDELMAATSTCFPDLISEVGKEEVKPLFDYYNKDLNSEGFIELAVIVRHQVHHYFHEHSGDHYPDPFESEYLQPICLALQHLTYFILIAKVHGVEISS